MEREDAHFGDRVRNVYNGKVGTIVQQPYRRQGELVALVDWDDCTTTVPLLAQLEHFIKEPS